MSQRRIAVLLVNVLVFVVFAELVSLTIYYYDTGHLFYLHRKTYELIPETRDRRLTGEGLHPYFGPTHKSGYPFDLPEKRRVRVDYPLGPTTIPSPDSATTSSSSGCLAVRSASGSARSARIDWSSACSRLVSLSGKSSFRCA